MRCTIGTSLVMAGLMIGVFAFRPPVENDSNLAQAQQGPGETTKQKEKDTSKEDQLTRNLDHKTRAELKTLTEMEFTEIPLRDALHYIADRHSIQFFFDKRAMDEANARIDTPINFNMHRVPLEMVLDLILNQIHLGYTVRNGVVIVTTEDALANSAEVRVYKVPDGGAEELAQLIPATIEPHSWRYTPVPAGLMYGGMPGGYGGMGGGPGGPQEFGAPDASGAMAGGGGLGGVGSIRVFRGVLVVSQTPEVHQKIEKLLDDLDKVLPPQSKTPGTGMMDPHSAPGYGGTTAPQGPGYPGPSARTPNYPRQSGSPQYPGQNRTPGYPGTPTDPRAPVAAEEFAPQPDAPTTTPGQPAEGGAVPASIPRDGKGADAAPRTPGKARN